MNNKSLYNKPTLDKLKTSLELNKINDIVEYISNPHVDINKRRKLFVQSVELIDEIGMPVINFINFSIGVLYFNETKSILFKLKDDKILDLSTLAFLKIFNSKYSSFISTSSSILIYLNSFTLNKSIFNDIVSYYKKNGFTNCKSLLGQKIPIQHIDRLLENIEDKEHTSMALTIFSLDCVQTYLKDTKDINENSNSIFKLCSQFKIQQNLGSF